MPLTIDPSDPNFIIDTDSGQRYPRPQNRRRAAGNVVGQRSGSPAEAAGNYSSPGLIDTAIIASQLSGAGPIAGLLGRGASAAAQPIYRGLQAMADYFPGYARTAAKGTEGAIRMMTGNPAGVNAAVAKGMPKSMVPPVGGADVLPAANYAIKTPRAYTPMQASVANTARKLAGNAISPRDVVSDPYADEIRSGNDLGLYYGPGGNDYNADQPDIQPPPAIDPVADALGIGVPPESRTASPRPSRGPSRGPSAPVPPARPSEEDIKKLRALQGYAKDYQSNSLPVFNEGRINWGTDAAGYGGEDNFGGDAADFFRADALRRAVPGLLGM